MVWGWMVRGMFLGDSGPLDLMDSRQFLSLHGPFVDPESGGRPPFRSRKKYPGSGIYLQKSNYEIFYFYNFHTTLASYTDPIMPLYNTLASYTDPIMPVYNTLTLFLPIVAIPSDLMTLHFPSLAIARQSNTSRSNVPLHLIYVSLHKPVLFQNNEIRWCDHQSPL